MAGSSLASSRFGGLLFVATEESLATLGEDVLARLGVNDGSVIHMLAGSDPYHLRQQIRDKALEVYGTHEIRGVVILGDYQDFPSRSMLCLDPNFQEQYDKTFGRTDEDDWLVWSDDLYGALGESLLPTVPVSRVPLVPETAVQSGGAAPGKKAGAVRAEEFGFGADIFSELVNRNGVGDLLAAPPAVDNPNYRAEMAGLFSDVERMYILLHGDEAPGILLMSGGKSTDVIKPGLFKTGWRTQALVFSGACWGVLIATWARGVVQNGDAVVRRKRSDSFALAMLERGARAVVGFSAHHYLSANRKNPSLGGELHKYFWEGVECCDLPPAEALFRAKTRYIQAAAAMSPGPGQKAIRMKTLWSATCIGLGW